MSGKTAKNIVVGIDIGTSKVVTLIGEISAEQRIEVIGIGASHLAFGQQKAMVMNIDTTIQAIQRSREEAELMAGYQIDSVYTGISGSHIRSLNSNGIVAIAEQEVVQDDVNRVIDAAKAVAIPADQSVLHILPQEFIIDDHKGIREPIGMTGVRLEANVHMVIGAVSAAQNITKCVQSCGMQVNDMALEQLASSYCVLSDDEKELGICLVDIGAGTTDIAVFLNGVIRHTVVIPIAGGHATSDIAMALRMPQQVAETLKVQHGCALECKANSQNFIEIPGIGDRSGQRISKRSLAEVVEPRYEELFKLVKKELERSRILSVTTRAVLAIDTKFRD